MRLDSIIIHSHFHFADDPYTGIAHFKNNEYSGISPHTI